MQSLSNLLQQGAAHVWLFAPTAILLGALHGLEQGHSKTMMAAFIIAIRGAVVQAILFGLFAAVSHAAVVWVVAIGGQHLGRNFAAEAIEPYLQLFSATIIVGVALRIIWRTRRDQILELEGHGHDRHDHHHGDEVGMIETGTRSLAWKYSSTASRLAGASVAGAVMVGMRRRLS